MNKVKTVGKRIFRFAFYYFYERFRSIGVTGIGYRSFKRSFNTNGYRCFAAACIFCAVFEIRLLFCKRKNA
jgi:hypothetical protein